MSLPFLTDDEISGICRPLKQHAAQIRFLRGLGLRVERRPDGTPLVSRADWERRHEAQNGGPARRGPKWSIAA